MTDFGKKLKIGDRISHTISEQDGWTLTQHFRVTEITYCGANLELVSSEVSFVGGHEQDQWPKVSYEVRPLGDPYCADCEKYNNNPNSSVPCREHQIIR